MMRNIAGDILSIYNNFSISHTNVWPFLYKQRSDDIRH